MKPIPCPKCGGFGMLTYDPAMPFSPANTNCGPWQCPYCMGIGVVCYREEEPVKAKANWQVCDEHEQLYLPGEECVHCKIQRYLMTAFY